jgi:hypothetical protein
MPDVDEQLRSYARWLAEVADAEAARRMDGTTIVTPAAHGRRGLWLIGAAAAVVVVTIAGLTLLTRAPGDDLPPPSVTEPASVIAPTTASSLVDEKVGEASPLDDDPESTSPVSSDTDAVADVPGGSGSSPWVLAIPDPPLEDRQAELVVPLGDAVFVWGGFVPGHQDGSEPPFNDGAIADLDDGTWRPVAEAPLVGGDASGVWTGSEVVVSNSGQVAAYDPAADSWRELSMPAGSPTETEPLVVVNHEVVLPFAGWAWNRDDGTWRRITPSPARVIAPSMSVIDGDLIVSGAPASAPTDTMALRYDSELDSWTELPPPGSQVYEGDATGVVGNDVILVSWLSMRAQAMDLDTLLWRDLPTFPQLDGKCPGSLQSVAESTPVVSMCGQHAALEPDANRWIAFDPPTTSNTFDLHAVNGGLLIAGSVLDTESGDWLRSPQLGPVSAGGATINRNVQPQLSRSAPADSIGVANDATITVELLAIDCVLEVGVGDHRKQTSVSSARNEAEESPETVDFVNQFGSYSLACPSPASYATAFDALTVRGERGAEHDAVPLFDPPLPPADSPEAMADAVAEYIEAKDQNLGRNPLVGLSAPSGDPVTFLVDSYYDEGAIGGETYTITLAETDAGWVIEEATVQLICTRAPTHASSDQTCE